MPGKLPTLLPLTAWRYFECGAKIYVTMNVTVTLTRRRKQETMNLYLALFFPCFLLLSSLLLRVSSFLALFFSCLEKGSRR
jgi:hypothetical protein